MQEMQTTKHEPKKMTTEELKGLMESLREDWSNNTCLGYVILAAKRMKFTQQQTKDLVDSVRAQFDWISTEEAKEVYNKSPY